MFNSVLVPLDGTPSMERSLPVAAALARETGATLRLLRPAFAHTGPGPDAADAHLAAVVEAKHYLAGQAGRLGSAGVAVETVVAHGEPS